MITKLFRIVFFLILYFVLCMIAVTTIFQSWTEGAQMLFSFGTPIALVWWGEKRRANRLAQSKNDVSQSNAEPARRSPKSQIKEKRRNRRDPSEQTARREQALRERNRDAILSDSSRSLHKSANETKPQYQPRKQDYAAIVRADRASAAELSQNADKKEQARTIKRKATRRTGWVPLSENVSIGGREIGGMVYVGTPPRLNNYGYRDKCRAYIDPSLSVARDGTDKVGNYMPYWPGYSEIPSQCRATYLDWLAGGRADPSYDPGYMFLYFYGLERRFVLDHPSEAEKREILLEVRRLKSLYPDNGSVQRYLGEFIQLAQLSLVNDDNDDTELEPVFDYRGWELPLSLKVAIGSRVGRGELISADWALSWLLCHPERRLRTPATRCVEEFRALFRLRFEERFPEGLKVNKPRKVLKSTYQSASSEFQAQIEPTLDGAKVPDISGLRKPVEIAQEVADEMMDDLDKLSRYLGRNPEGRGSVEAQALLPQELWELFPSEELERLKAWAADRVGSGGLISVLDVVERLEGSRPEKLSKRILTGAADALARIGFGFAPDPRFALRSPKLDEPVVLFELGEAVGQLEDVSDEYRAALIEAALGSFVAHADGKITESERKSLLAKATDVDGLSQQEYRRLAANVEWMLAVAPDMTLLRRKLKDTGPEAMASIRSALVAAAHADGVIQSEEIAGIEKIYKVLGLDPALVYSDLHAGDVSDGPVRVRAAQPSAAGEAIPDVTPSGKPKLDAARIAAIQSDTARVSSVLGDIFDDTPEVPEDAEADETVLGGLDAKHSHLVKALIAQDHWTEEAFGKLCLAAGLLASGAIEDINEWAYETYDEALLDEYDGYDVSPDLAAQLKKKIEEEMPHVEA